MIKPKYTKMRSTISKINTCLKDLFQIKYINPTVPKILVTNILLQWCQMNVKILAYSMLIHKLVQADMKGNIKAPHHWPFVRRINRWPVDSPHKGPVMRNEFPCHDVIMYITLGSAWYGVTDIKFRLKLSQLIRCFRQTWYDHSWFEKYFT